MVQWLVNRDRPTLPEVKPATVASAGKAGEEKQTEQPTGVAGESLDRRSVEHAPQPQQRPMQH